MDPHAPIRDRQTVSPDGEPVTPLPAGVKRRDAITQIDDRGSVVELFDPRWLWQSTKAFRSGSTAPLKMQIFDAGTNVSSASLPVRMRDIVRTSSQTTVATADSGNANPDDGFRFDPALGAGGGYIYNSSTKGLLPGTYNARFRVGADGRTYTITFAVK